MASNLSAPGPIRLWANAAAQKKEELKKVNTNAILLTSLDYESMQLSVEKLKQSHSSRKSTRLLAKLEPVISHLQTFSDAITVLAQTSDVVSLIWGSMKLVLDVASAVSDTLETIVGMYETIARVMPRFHEYMDVFPQRKRLQEALLRIYCDYLDFSISAAKYLKQGTIVHLLSRTLRALSLRKSFNTIVERITESNREFEAEAQLAHTVFTKDEFRHIRKVFDNKATDPLPPDTVFSVHFSQNHKFYGREDELKKVSACLSTNSSSQKCCVLHGMPGVGKTQTAVEFAYRNRSAFRYIFWIRAEDEATLSQEFCKIISLVSPTASHAVSDSHIMREKTRMWLCRNQNWLIIFDNAEGSGLLNLYWPTCGHGSILITSQNRTLIHRAHLSLELKPLPPNEGSVLIMQYLGDQKEDSESSRKWAMAISIKLGGLPLLLAGLAGHILDSSSSLWETLEDISASPDEGNYISSSINPDSATFLYERPLQMAFNLSLKGLPEVALAVLEIMSMLSPDAISEAMLIEDLTDTSLSFLGYQNKARFVTEVRSHLLTRHLIQFQKSTDPNGENQYSIHRQLQWKVHGDLNEDPEKRQRAFDRALELIYRTFPPISEFMVPMHDAWKSYQRSIGHVLHLNEVFCRAKKSDAPLRGRFHFAEILASAGNYLYEVRLMKPGLSVTETSAGICRDLRDRLADPSSDPSEHQYEETELIALQATALTLSWGILWTEGISRVHEAQTKIDSVLPLREEQLKLSITPDRKFNSRFRLSSAYNDTACQMIHTGRFDQAATLLEKAVQLRADLECERPIPPLKHATPRQCLAGVRLAQNRNTEARGFIQEAEEIVKKLEVPNPYFWHHSAIESVQLGEFEEALHMLQGVYRDVIDMFGETTRLTRDVVYTIALANYYLKRWEDARIHLEDCLAGLENTDWPRVCIIRAMYLHGLVLRALGQEEDAAEQSISTSLAEVHALLDEHLPTLQIQILNRDSVDPIALFDFVCPFYAGQITVGQLDILHLG